MIGKIIIVSLIGLAVADIHTPTLENSAVECSGNRTYTECGSACPPQCSDGDNPKMCVMMCMPPGCYCMGDHANSEDGKCILKADCPINRPKRIAVGEPNPAIPCPTNENYDFQGNDCERTCHTRLLRHMCIKKQKAAACTCSFDKGFVRGKNNECISTKECKKP
uniref:TIL domain-containing protein n=1 Tax=Rhabditophanes sp. KR3021 TaxID=114890 RepID=A0AC35TQC3_9BILA